MTFQCGIVQNMIDANPVVSLTETDNFCMLLTQYFSWSAPSNVEIPKPFIIKIILGFDASYDTFALPPRCSKSTTAMPICSSYSIGRITGANLRKTFATTWKSPKHVINLTHINRSQQSDD